MTKKQVERKEQEGKSEMERQNEHRRIGRWKNEKKQRKGYLSLVN